MNPNRHTPKYITIKMEKVKDREFERQKEKKELITRKPWLSADFSIEILQTISEWQDIFKVLKGKICNLEYSTQNDYPLE